MRTISKLVFAVYLSGLQLACSSSLTDAQYVERAQGYLDEGELEKASIELKNALLQNQENAQARWLLGKIYLEIGNPEAAEKELRRASEYGVSDGAVIPMLAKSLLAQDKREELQALTLASGEGKQQQSVLMAAQGLGELAQGNLDGAARKIDLAVSLDPRGAYAGVAKARFQTQKQEFDLARKELGRVLELNADYSPAWQLLGDLERQDKNLSKAEAAYTKAANNRADNFTDLLKRAEIRVQQKEYEAAQKDIDTLKKRYPNHSGVMYVQGLIHYYQGRLPQAKEAFQLSVRANEKNAQALLFLSLTHMQMGEQFTAMEYSRRYHTLVPGSIQGRKLMASMELESRNYVAAEELMRPVVISRTDDSEALTLLARALLGQNKTDEALELLRKAVNMQPDSAMAHRQLGVGLLAAGKHEEGVEQIQQAISMDPGLEQTYVMLVQHYISQKDLDKALALAKSYRDRQPDNPIAYNQLGRVMLASGNEADAVAAFSQANRIAPGDPVANLNLAALAVKKQAYQDARNYYQEVLTHHENHLSTLLSLAALDELEKNRSAMLENLQKAAEAHPGAVQPRVLLARHYLAQGEPEMVPRLMADLQEEQMRHPYVLDVMAMSQLAQGQYQNAMYNVEEILKREPSSTQHHYLLAQAYFGLDDKDRSIRQLEKVIELNPRHFAARLALARLMLTENQHEKVREHLVILKELSPEHPEVLRLQAALSAEQGDPDTTADLLGDLFIKSPTTDSMLSLASQKETMGEQMAALELQKQWVEKHPDDQIASLALAGAYFRRDQDEQAIAQYMQLLEKDENNVAALNDLAWYLRNKQPAKALEYAERANKLAPESAMVMDTYAVLLLKNGDIVRAKRKIAQVLAQESQNPAFRYHAAMIDAAAGDKISAINRLESLLGEGRDFTEKADAERLFEKLKQGG